MTDASQQVQCKPANRVRWANIERLRILAMLDIIGFHAATHRTLLLGGLGLSTFLMLTNLFNCTVSNKRGFCQFAKDKLNRLLYPWLFWCVVYAADKALTAARKGVSIRDVFDPYMVFYGTNVHLWFVPFALCSALIVGFLQARTAHLPHGIVILVAASIGALTLLASAHLLDRYEFFTPFDQYIYALPSTFIGFALGRTLLIDVPQQRRNVRLLFCAGAVVVAVSAMILPIELFPVRYAISAILITGALAWPGKSDWLTTTMTPILLGVYLIHPLVIRITKRSDVFDDYIAIYAATVFVLSAIAVWLMRKTRLARFT
jgi:fucose 4-O-acetylase-like acetyltransferase